MGITGQLPLLAFMSSIIAADDGYQYFVSSCNILSRVATFDKTPTGPGPDRAAHAIPIFCLKLQYFVSSCDLRQNAHRARAGPRCARQAGQSISSLVLTQYLTDDIRLPFERNDCLMGITGQLPLLAFMSSIIAADDGYQYFVSSCNILSRVATFDKTPTGPGPDRAAHDRLGNQYLHDSGPVGFFQLS